ncbi:MAG: protein translocase subunit SecD [Desulfobacteraceae bacterium]|nr:MAG: protein translocase subunit SecD [Desulfobacteraceae bacterium]
MLNFKRISILIILLAAVICLVPTFFENAWPNIKIKRGLDLQGGMHLVLEVQTIQAVEAEVDRLITELKKDLRKESLKHMGISRTPDNAISVKVSGDQNIDGFNTIISDRYRGLTIKVNRQDASTKEFALSLPESETDDIKKMAVQQVLETIRNRIDEFGVSEPDIRLQGQERILIQLPGVTDPARAKALIGRTAKLTFQLVDEAGDLNAAIKGNVPVGSTILYQHNKDAASGQTNKVPFLIKKRILVDGSQLTNARVEFDQFNMPEVGIEFSRKGARIFERITAENINKRLAIVLDKKVYSAPVIQTQIAGGKARITGNFTIEEARDLAIALRAGSLPADVKYIEERTVGPTLGADSIRMGLNSMLIGGVLVILFMLIYYRVAGMIANIALIANIILIGGGLAAIQATLSLPGIAGIILTIGMAVDANVIIFERIREELTTGKTALAAVEAGFDRATLTIMDANVTTLIVAVVLLQFGTGPIKGFGVTLTLGIISSLFTALILSKTLFELILQNRKASLSI